MSTILEILLKEAEVSASSMLDYQRVSSEFDNFFDSLVSEGIIKSFSQDRFDFMCQRSLDVNSRRLDRKISK